ncbi:MAG: LmbE family protein [Sulfobacillus thermosulfidooxidans]|uniref:LmbE family protein n=1 Tax=Sulfobacillus thermotolerans TaxID=338644 RepID=A0ABN5H362_9FIRM|nr:PIG-L family deacetylase [Sulfobacillus sp. hq2]AUW95026.1 LmbE family protein [Sulfobacillus thermotolerans]MCY0909485.1 PIG-L family deacetylase [Sulfobacillus thermotolerans]POB10373.1 LmbE family protein [Sulfobacillus sp. hq2]PSR37894.1 MAG: LmbE family protein [Sulfobacillus thermosulfidooxidans]
MRVLAIGAHAGDMDLTCGAVLAQHVLSHDEVTIAHLTLGEKGHPTMPVADYAIQKRDEAQGFATAIGAHVRFFSYHDAELPATGPVVDEVVDLIRELKPQIVVTHWKHSIHPDHANTHQVVEQALFYASLKTYERPAPSHFVPFVYYADNWEDSAGFEPQVFVEIQPDAYERWLQGVSHYAYARGETSHFPFIAYYNALMVVRGAPRGFPMAQAFMVPDGDLHRKMSLLGTGY